MQEVHDDWLQRVLTTVALPPSAGIWGRPLGNVVYFMVSPLTEKPVCDALLDALIAEIEAEDGRRAEEGSHGGNGAVSGKAGNGGEAAGQGRAQPVP